MIGEAMQERASLYVLGQLDGQSATEFEREVRADPELQRLVRDLSSAAAVSAKAMSGPAPRPGLRSEILSRVSSATELKPEQLARRNELIRLIAQFDIAKLAWEPTPFEGVSACTLPAEAGSTTEQAFLKIRANCAYPPHTHHGGEDCVVLSGAIRDHSGVHKRGDYVFYGPNTEHLDLKALEGEECVIFVAAHGGVEYHA